MVTRSRRARLAAEAAIWSGELNSRISEPLPNEAPRSSPRLSVVVIGRNEGARLARCLDSIGRMRPILGGRELIYVDSGSTDGSVALAARRGASVIELRAEKTNAAMGRNAGWRAARGELILFLDGDTVLAPDFVARSVKAFADPRVGIVWGVRREIDPEASVFQRVLDLDWIFPTGLSEYCGGDALIRRRTLSEVGGYDETMIAGEEPEMCQRIRRRGYLILHTAEPMTGHDLAIHRWSQYWLRAVRAGYAYAMVAHRSRQMELALWRTESRRNLWQGGSLLVTLIAGPITSLLLSSPWPLLLTGLIVAALSIRTAWRATSRTNDPTLCLLYGLHSQLQQVPILLGQCLFRLDARQGRRRRAIEYK